MAVTTTVAQGHLTTSVATIRTGANSSEYLVINFRNSGSSTRIMSFYEDGSTDPDNHIIDVTLQAKYVCKVQARIGSGNDIRAKQDAGSDVYYSAEIVINP